MNGKPATQRLKEYADRARVTIVYTCSKEGPDHCPTFLARVTVKDRANSTVAQSQGRDGSKKVARNIAAAKVLGLLTEVAAATVRGLSTEESETPERAPGPEPSDSSVRQENREPESSFEHTRRPEEAQPSDERSCFFLPENQPSDERSCLLTPEAQPSDLRHSFFPPDKQPVSALQELCQKRKWRCDYKIVEKDRAFTASCWVYIPMPVYKAGTVIITFKEQGLSKAAAKEAAALKVYNLAVVLSKTPCFHVVLISHSVFFNTPVLFQTTRLYGFH